MSNKNAVPDAWDDEEFPTIADTQTKSKQPAIIPREAKVSRSERRARHAEANKQLWEAAENPETFHFVEARSTVPLKSEFKPTVKVLSRKPKPNTATTSSDPSGIGNLSIKDEDDSEEEARKVQQLSFAERQEKARLERIEKEKRYAEVRERLFGSPAPSQEENSGRGSPTNGASSAGRARQGGRGNRKGGKNVNSSRPDSNQASSADQSPVRATHATKQLFDPTSSEKPGSVYHQRRNQVPLPDGDTIDVNRPIRNPRGPDGSGRGGFGFGPRGGGKSGT